jgi:hypothetical protein
MTRTQTGAGEYTTRYRKATATPPARSFAPNDLPGRSSGASSSLWPDTAYRRYRQLTLYPGERSVACPSAGMSLDEDERLRSDAEVECFLRSVAPGS